MIIDSATMAAIKMTLADLETRVSDVENISSPASDVSIFGESHTRWIPERLETDTECSDPDCYSLQRHTVYDQFYLYGMVNPVVATPALTDLGTGAGQYLVALRHNVSGGIPTLKWSTLTAAFTGSDTDILVKCSATDTVAGYLYTSMASTPEECKLKPGTGITLSVDTDGLGKQRVKITTNADAATTHTHNNHSWKFTKTSDTGGTVTLGAVYIGGVAKTISGWPSGGILSGVTTTTKYWVAIDYLNATATWGSNATLPNNISTVEYWHVLTLTCAASVISAIFQPWCADIRALLNP